MYGLLAQKTDLVAVIDGGRPADKGPVQQLLTAVAECLPVAPVAVCASFRPILLDLVSRCLGHMESVEQLEAVCCHVLPTVLRVGPSCLLNMVLASLRSAAPLGLFDRLSSHELPVETLRSLAVAADALLRISMRFSTLWNWAPLLALVKHRDEEVRFAAASATARYLRMSDAERREFEPLNANVAQRLSIVAQRELPVMHVFEWDMLSPGAANDGRQIMTAADLSADVVSVCGVLLPRRSSSAAVETSKLVYTASAVKNLQAISLALSRGRPVVVAGDTGAGKTVLLAEVARITGNTNMLSIHLGDQTDAKVLLGTYVCTDVPGEFRWQPGALTQAVMAGMWVLIEDIDLAPLDVMSVLLPLLESRKLFIPGRGEEVVAADGFQLLATQSLAGGRKAAAAASSATFLSGLWTRVVIEPMSSGELCQVLSQLYPGLAPHALSLVQVRDQLLTKAELQFHMRNTSARDVKKWFHRIHMLHPAVSTGLKKPLTTEGRRRIFAEALDCFSGMMVHGPARVALIAELGRGLGLSPEMIEQHVAHRKPELVVAADRVTVGRALPLPRLVKWVANSVRPGSAPRSFVLTRHALRTLEKVAVALCLNEPVLCVGETGVGKTAAIQHLADLMGQELVVVNLNQQSDSSDLLGSFRPLEMRVLCLPLKRQFDSLFARSFSQSANQQFLDQVEKAFTSHDWKRFLALLRQAEKLNASSVSAATASKKRKVSDSVQAEWNELSAHVARLEVQQQRLKQSFAFAFVEGSLVNALRNGCWILLDEINLASSDMLESISGLLEGESLLLAERGDTSPIPRHPNFRLFACMNPSTNAGRKDLPPGLRNRFSEYFVDECEAADDLVEIVQSYIRGDVAVCNKIVQFYLSARAAASALRDGAGRSPKYSLRSLIRALEFASSTQMQYGLSRSLYDGICMTFLTQLNLDSQVAMAKMIRTAFPPGQAAQVPAEPPGGNHVRVQHFWIEKGQLEPMQAPRYILTHTITKHLKNLARVVVTRRYPALLQGPTAAGKTSMVEYLAKITGHRFVRINNHEHTDISEYMGSYVSDDNGRLVFREGVLVEAVRNGYWIVLDELNLAPSDVLESLNRLLDDNRELFIPETQEVVKPHRNFALFATQNPPGLYGGRKLLSPAFSNRFLELHFDDLPDEELQEILQKRCDLAPSYSAKLVEVMRDLQRRRQSSQIFAGKHGFITLRDLFKWAERQPVGYQQLAEEGYMLLAERLRSEEEKLVIKTVLEAHMPGARLDTSLLYRMQPAVISALEKCLSRSRDSGASRIVWTDSFQRMFSLVQKCIRNKEPVLLIGGTGCGKTSVCQVLAALLEQDLRILNLHEHSETADFLGGLRPLRDRAVRGGAAMRSVAEFFFSIGQPDQFENPAEAVKAFNAASVGKKKHGHEGSALFAKAKSAVQEYETLFCWYDGPLVEAMKRGQLLLLDEISLAEDAVLERLNSVLESGRTLLLAEKGGSRPQEIRAHSDFRILATMNPGGDFGKRELSPALRNRFTEIWVPPVASEEDICTVVMGRMRDVPTAEQLVQGMLQVASVLRAENVQLNLRDFLSWADFLRAAASFVPLQGLAFLHGACLVCLDGLGVSSSLSPAVARQVRDKAVVFITSQLFPNESLQEEEATAAPVFANGEFRVGSFALRTTEIACVPVGYSLSRGTTLTNLARVMRACALSKPILLEGSPGQGKTTLIAALAKQTGRRMVRINLSEETDMMDLLGADLPVEGGKGGEFHWQDGIFLQALKQGDWVLLDELNLASQSILEGLNSVLDHRASIFVPELNASFDCPPSFRIFACQNPSAQGGGRKGLPKSFLNRFTKVYMEPLTADDMLFVGSSLYPAIQQDHLKQLIRFNEAMHHHTMVKCSFGQQGRPWEFNLRDILRCCQLMGEGADFSHDSFFAPIYELRLRTQQDRDYARKLFRTVFPKAVEASGKLERMWSATPSTVRIGRVDLPRQSNGSGVTNEGEVLMLLKSRLPELEAIAECVRQQWMPILVGGAASGKTSLVHVLAQLTGNSLHTFEMNAGIDTTELLGGFEQLDLAHHRTDFVRELDQVIATACRRSCNSTLESAQKLLHIRHTLAVQQDVMQATGGGRAQAFSAPEEILLRQLLQMTNASIELHHRLDAIQRAGKRQGAAVFEWRDGLLIRALERGDWLLIDNVNFCNPAVLDRLNPLLEPDGELIVNERGPVNGQVRVVKPHPNFRIFLAMDPRNGEISRPMRNRGVEICLLAPTCLSHDDYLRTASLRSDGAMTALVGSMGRFHDRVAGDADCVLGQGVSVRDFLAWVDFFGELRKRGATVNAALRSSMEHVYVRNRKSAAQRAAVVRHFAELQSENLQLEVPHFPDAREIAWDSLAVGAASDSVFCNVAMLVARASKADIALRGGLQGEAVSVVWNAPGVRHVWQLLDAENETLEKASFVPVFLAAKHALSEHWVEAQISSRKARTSVGRSKLFHTNQLDQSALKSEQEMLLYPALHHAQSVIAQGLVGISNVEGTEVARQLVAVVQALWKCGIEGAMINRALLMVLWRRMCKLFGKLGGFQSAELERLAAGLSHSMSGQEWELQSVLARGARGLAPRSPVQAGLAARVLHCDVLSSSPTCDRSHRGTLAELGALVLGIPFGAQKTAADNADAVLRGIETVFAAPAAQKTDDNVMRLRGHSMSDLFPLAEVLSLRWERILLSSAVSDEELERYGAWGVAQTARPPVDFAPYRILLWMRQDGKDEWRTLQLQCEQEAEFRWLWQLFEGSSARIGGLGSRGSVNLFRDVPTLLVASLADTARVPLCLAASKLGQLSRLYSMLLSSAVPEELSLSAESRRLERMLQRITAAYRPRCAAERRPALELFSRLVARAIENGIFEGGLAESCEALKSCGDERLVMCFDSFLGEWLAGDLVRGSLPERVAGAWVYVGLLNLLLLAPSCPVDPAARYTLKARFFSSVIEEASATIDQRLRLERWLYDNADSDVVRQLRKWMVDDNSSLVAVEAKVQSRGDNAPDFGLLFAEVERFVRSFGDVSRIKALKNEATREQNEQFQSSASSFLQTLHTQFGAYRDVTVPLSTAVLQMRFGLELLTHVKRESSPLSSVVTRLLACDACPSIVEGFANLLGTCSAQDVASLGPGMFVALLQWAELAVAEVSPPSARLLDALEVLFRAFAHSWSVTREREAEAKQAREATVRYKTNTEVVIETDEQRDERLYKQMFPSYANAFADLAPEDMAQDFAADAVREVVEEEPNDAGRSLTSVLLGRSRGSLEEHLLEVCKLHAKVFSTVSVETGNQLANTCEASFAAAVHLVAAAPARWLVEGTASLEWQLFAVQQARTLLEKKPLAPIEIERRLAKGPGSFSLFEVADSTTITSRKIADVYRDSNPDEGRLMLEPLVGMDQRVGQLLEEWPEHAILLQVQKCVQRLLATSWNEPLMKLVTGLDYLMLHAQQWEQNAASHVSLEPHLGQVALLILRWRKLELLSWPLILTSRVQVHEMQAMHWWFHFHRLLEGARGDLRPGEEEADSGFVSQTVDAVLVFVESATLGDFRARLAILSAFADQLRTEVVTGKAAAGSPRHRLGVVLGHAHGYFRQFLGAHEQCWKTSTKELDEQIKEFLRLIKWDSSSYVRLQEVAEKSKRKVNKFAKKMDALLRVPMGPPVFARVEEGLKSPDEEEPVAGKAPPSRIPPLLDDAFLVSTPAEAAGDASVNEGRAARVPSLLRRTRDLYLENLCGQEAVKQAEDIEDLTLAVIEDSAQLQLPEVEGRQRRVAFQRLLKALKERGLSWRAATTLMDQQLSLGKMFQIGEATVAFPSSLTGLPLADFLADSFSRAEKYVWRIAMRMSMLRKVAEKSSPDLDRRQVLLCLGHGENLLAVALMGKLYFSMALAQLGRLQNLLKALEEPGRAAVNVGPSMERVAAALQSARRAASFQSLVGSIAAGSAWMKRLESALQTAAGVEEDLRGRLLLRRNDAGGEECIPWRDADVAALTRACDCLRAFSVAANAPLPPGVPLQAALSLKRAAARCEVVLSEASAEIAYHNDDGLDQSEAASSAEALVEAVLLGVQGIVKLEKVEGVTERAQQWPGAVAKLGLDRSADAVRRALKQNALGNVALAPLVRQHVLLALRWLVEAVTEWSATVKFGHVFLGLVASLMQKGFCGQKEEEDDGKNDGELQFDDDVEGTGMGEGQGKNDVSKQIEDAEEQLMGTTNEKQEEGGDEKEEDDAIDMELDFDGNLHDMDKDEQPEKEDGEDDSEDREMGDDKQEDVIDEKMWDDPSDAEGDAEGNQKETFEKDDPLKMQKGMELELAAKQGEEEEEKDGQGEEEMPEDQEDENAEDENEAEDDKEKRAEEDEVVDKQGNVQQPEDFQMPPDAMDMSSDGGEGEGKEEKEDGEEKEEGAEEDAEAEAMERSGDEAEDVEAPPQDVEGDMQDKADVEQAAEEEEEVEDEEGEKQQGRDGDQEEEPLPEEAEKEPEEEENDHNAATKERDEKKDDEAKWGVRERGAGAVEIKGTGETKGQKPEEKEEQEGEGAKQGDEDKEDAGAGAGGDQGDGGEGPPIQGHGQQQTQKHKQQKHLGPNPLRKLGDAMREFRRKVADKERADVQHDQQQGEGTKEPRAAADDQEEQYADDGQEQALGEANEDQKQQMPTGDKDGEEDEDSGGVMDEGKDEEKDEEEVVDSKPPATADAPTAATQKPAAPAPKKVREEVPEEEQGAGAKEKVQDRGFGALMPMEESDEEAAGEEGEKDVDEAQKVKTGEELRQELLEQQFAGSDEGARQWRECSVLVAPLAAALVEQLRLLLLPTRATSLVGDFRTGKRINMKRVIPYIASDFKKDKIWLRRKKPTKRNYQIMVCIDDSRSMRDHNKGQTALQALATMCVALSTLESGQMAVAKFGSEVSLLHSFEDTWSDQSGAKVFSAFSFGQAETNVHGLLGTTLQVMEEQRQRGSRDAQDNMQLAFVISDGLLSSRGAQLARMVGEAAEKNVMLVFVLIDNQGEGAGSVLDIQSIVQHKGKMARKAYMDSFPFPYYVVLRDIDALPMVLSDALRQWIELHNQTQ